MARRRSDDARSRRQLALQVAVEQCRVALGKISRGAEDHEVEQVDRNDAGGHDCLSAYF
jgi:hypothetical protein